MFIKWLHRGKKLKRVCFLNPQGYLEYPPPLGQADTGGQTLYVLQLAKALGEKGIKVDIFHRKFGDYKEVDEPFENVRIIHIPAGSKTFMPKENLYEVMPEFVSNIRKYIREEGLRYNIIHSHYWDGGYAALMLVKALKIPHVHTPHSLGKMKAVSVNLNKTPVQKLKPAYRYQVRVALEQRIYHDAQAIIVLCETSRIRLLERYIVDFEKLMVIYPGVDTRMFNSTKNGVDKKVDLQANALLTMSRIVPAKGLDRVINALPLLKGKVKFHLYIGGGNEENSSEEEKITQKQLHQLVKKHHLEKYVTFLGFVPHTNLLSAYYRAADIFLLAGRYEPFGLTALEAMACGATPIVTEEAGSKEVIVDGLNGIIADYDDTKQIAKTIIKLLTHKKLNKKIAENATFTVRENYAWDKIVEKFINLYKGLL